MATDFKQFLKTIEPRLQEALKRIPGIVKVEGLQFIHDNFSHQGFERAKGTFDKWKPRKKLYGKAAKASEGRAILVKTGNLQRSWDSETTVEPTRVLFTSDKPYAEPHNLGSKVQPQREMIGPSTALDAMIETKIDKLMDSVFK